MDSHAPAMEVPSAAADAQVPSLLESVEAPEPDPRPPPPRDATITVLDRRMTYSDALKSDLHLIHEESYVAKVRKMTKSLWKRRATLAAITRHHLNLGDNVPCEVAGTRYWMRGNFNICIPIEVQLSGSADSDKKTFMFRCAMPFKMAQRYNPGTMDEKVGSEVATYVWMQEKCPDIPIPHLYGFGLLGGTQYTHSSQRPFYARTLHYFRRFYYRHFSPETVLSHYVPHPTSHKLPAAYMLLEHVGSENSQMLSSTWDDLRDEPTYRQRLFEGLSRIMLSLARVPQPRIGSFRFEANGTITLSNRPLLCCMMIMENDGTPRSIHRDTTYPSSEQFVSDLMEFHDVRFMTHPNAVYDRRDCQRDMAFKVLARACAHEYIKKSFRNGPFVLQFDDLHASNIFVDKDWNVTHIVDLEWVNSLPVEKLAVPHWLTGCNFDEVKDTSLIEYDQVRQEFMTCFERAEENAPPLHNLPLTAILDDGWETGSTWFWQGLASRNAFDLVFDYHIRPRFLSSDLTSAHRELLSRFWCYSSPVIVDRKVAEYKEYDKDLRRLFERREDAS